MAAPRGRPPGRKPKSAVNMPSSLTNTPLPSSPATVSVLDAFAAFGQQLHTAMAQVGTTFSEMETRLNALETLVHASSNGAAGGISVPQMPDFSAMKTKELRQFLNDHDLTVDLDEYDELVEKQEAVANAAANKYGRAVSTTQSSVATPSPVSDSYDGEEDPEPSFESMELPELRAAIKTYKLDVDLASYLGIEEQREAVAAAYLESYSDPDDTISGMSAEPDSGDEEDSDWST